MIITVALEIDEAKATAYNASLYEPEHDDPVQGDGRSLVLDVLTDEGIDGLINASTGLRACIKSVECEIDSEPFSLNQRQT